MNRALPYAALVLALTALGCGGSSTGSSTSTVGASGLTTPQIEAQVFTSSTATGSAPVVEDTLNIQTGELVEFQVVAYDSAGVRHVLGATNWTWSDSANSYGTLDPASGLFAVGSAATPSRQIVNARYNGATVAAYYNVNPYQSRVIGQVIASDTKAGVRGVGVTFYASDNTVAGYTLSSYDGTFRASVRANAVKFSVDPTTLGTGYWQSFSYGLNPAYATDPTASQLLSYDDGVDTCDATFQTLFHRDATQIGSSLVIGENFLFAATQPCTLLTPVTPANTADTGLIYVNSRTSARPASNGCSG